MALTKVKNSNLDDADLVTLADNGVGTGANQIVQRDGSGDIPGVLKSDGDGSSLTGVLKSTDIGSTIQGYDATILVGTDIDSTVQGYDADTTKNNVANTFSADQTFTALTETKTIKSNSFTPNLSTEGTVYSCTGTMTITMPAVEDGKSFTIIHALSTLITWSGTIKWSTGAPPTAGAGIDIYVFLSDGSYWYGMQAGTGFA